jgi:hypothetical protein
MCAGDIVTDRFKSLSTNRLLFDLGSRLGSLEGYLYAQEKVDKNYLPNWLINVAAGYGCLAPAVRNEIRGEYLALLHKVHNLLRDAYGSEDANTVKLAAMIATAARPEGESGE